VRATTPARNRHGKTCDQSSGGLAKQITSRRSRNPIAAPVRSHAPSASCRPGSSPQHQKHADFASRPENRAHAASARRIIRNSVNCAISAHNQTSGRLRRIASTAQPCSAVVEGFLTIRRASRKIFAVSRQRVAPMPRPPRQQQVSGNWRARDLRAAAANTSLLGCQLHPTPADRRGFGVDGVEGLLSFQHESPRILQQQHPPAQHSIPASGPSDSGRCCAGSQNKPLRPTAASACAILSRAGFAHARRKTR